MRCLLRPASVADYEAAAALLGACCPERAQPAAAWRPADADDAGSRIRRLVAVDPAAGAVTGYAAAWRVRAAQYRMDLAVDPDRRRRGIGSGLLERLLNELDTENTETLQARTMDDRPEALTFLNNRGFVETQRMCELRLDLREADVDRFLPAVERLKQQGITFVSLAEEQARCPDVLRRLYRLQVAVLPTWPDPDPLPGEPPMPYEAFVRQLESRHAIPEAFFLARSGDEYLGYSGLAAREGSRNTLDSSGTAVHPDYRRQGLATALKTLGLIYARENGCTVLTTRSASPGMVALNEKLGFRRGRSEVRLVRRLSHEAPSSVP